MSSSPEHHTIDEAFTPRAIVERVIDYLLR